MDVSCLTVIVMNSLNPSWTGGLNLFGEREYNFCTLSCKFSGKNRPRSAVFNLPLICPECKRSSSHKWCALLNKWETLLEWLSKAQRIDEALSIHTCIQLTLNNTGFNCVDSQGVFFNISIMQYSAGWIHGCGTEDMEGWDAAWASSDLVPTEGPGINPSWILMDECFYFLF